MPAHNSESFQYIFVMNMELSDAYACVCGGPYMLVALTALSMKFLLYSSTQMSVLT